MKFGYIQNTHNFNIVKNEIRNHDIVNISIYTNRQTPVFEKKGQSSLVG